MSDTPPAFRLTYATMFDPPAQLHERFDEALQRVRAQLGADHAMTIGGQRRGGAQWIDKRAPADARLQLGRFAAGTAADARAAVDAARAAAPAWAATPWRERVALLRRAAQRIEARVFDLAAAVALEVGKNRMEALGEVQETADLIAWYCDRMEEADGFERALPDDPLPGWRSHNRTRLRPYGVWAVIAPFNFPFALAGGPVGAALVAGNTVVFKTASDTPWSGRLLMDVFEEAALPPGVVNLVAGAGGEVGDALVGAPDVAGVTFTGSHEVGTALLRRFAAGTRPRPVIAEMGGKNPAIVTHHADLDRAATGIVRSAFGLQGQKCSACSRVYVERSVADALRERLVERTRAIAIGDPVLAAHWMGPVINAAAVARYRRAVDEIRAGGRVDVGGEVLQAGDFTHGHFVAPTVARVPYGHRLWRDELFLPLVLVGEVESLDEALARANDSDYGLTAGFYGAPDEVEVFLDRIEAGVTYVNRPQGATTGAWPGYQPFGGWKGSGSTGKAIGSFWYLPQYLREQSVTVVE
ncbi:aldehyde dehydrogenase family protein [Azohydromonas sediminis]|uniref:aldehyde dehydrogenase family protein n=1 Tax=Azohydromonas sediminis TaxID=2259674 RepID=UPI000E65C8EF|nr:aldehyde dehydrogenase family protein [Azohydromonas sediminis]